MNKSFYYNTRNALAIIFLVALSVQAVNSQDTEFKVTIEVTDVNADNKASGKIDITIDKADTYEYILYDKEPWDNGKQLAIYESNDTFYQFSGLTKGRYYICVRNSTKASYCKSVTVNK